jgi:acetyl-CoA acyltransferase
MTGQIRDVYIVAYGRSALARSGEKGALRETHPVDIGGFVLKGVLDRLSHMDHSALEDVIVGCAFPAWKQGENIGRLIARRAGLGYEVPAMTLTRLCASGLEAIGIAAAKIMAGEYDVLVAGGVESMTSLAGSPHDTENLLKDKWLFENDRGYYDHPGVTAEKVAEKCGITREEMDAFAVESHKRAAEAQEAGKFDEEIIPLEGVDEDGNAIVFDKDQGIRKGSNIEKLATLKPCFKKGGSVTAATSSQTTDGASFVVLMSGDATAEHDVKPIARFLGTAVSGLDPNYMGLGPILATPKIMKRTGLDIDDMDVIELNEAFAAQAIPCIRELGFDPLKVNVNGGAIALGHPLGATGAVLVSKVISELKRIGGKYGLITMCIGGGMGEAGVIELL